ncbi:unnamed protein product [Euphydryas editha]|uniref:Uncharacterized protein n=1 Tax=Euphydryas editha TaxID=104508 RepID=A0AAU9U6W2_EUPED|nr:unnamed protein product [Euphydryas editha]
MVEHGLQQPQSDVLLVESAWPQDSTSYAVLPSVRVSACHAHRAITECILNWTPFQHYKATLWHAPNARPLGKVVRFLPESVEEFQVVQNYLAEPMKQDSSISWYCYSPEADLPSKVSIRGLPFDKAPEEMLAALQEPGFPAERAKGIPPTKGRHGCNYFEQLVHL